MCWLRRVEHDNILYKMHIRNKHQMCYCGVSAVVATQGDFGAISLGYRRHVSQLLIVIPSVGHRPVHDDTLASLASDTTSAAHESLCMISRSFPVLPPPHDSTSRLVPLLTHHATTSVFLPSVWSRFVAVQRLTLNV